MHRQTTLTVSHPGAAWWPPWWRRGASPGLPPRPTRAGWARWLTAPPSSVKQARAYAGMPAACSWAAATRLLRRRLGPHHHGAPGQTSEPAARAPCAAAQHVRGARMASGSAACEAQRYAAQRHTPRRRPCMRRPARETADAAACARPVNGLRPTREAATRVASGDFPSTELRPCRQAEPGQGAGAGGRGPGPPGRARPLPHARPHARPLWRWRLR